MKKRRIWALIVCFVLILSGFLVLWIPNGKHSERNAEIIAHAGGEVSVGGKEYAYTNTKEAFLLSYQKGVLLFEFDLMFTSDGYLVCSHKWDARYFGKSAKKSPPNYAEFATHKVLGELTTLSFLDLVELLEKYPDIQIVLDIKDKDYKKAYEYIVYQTLKNSSHEILDRFIPYIYSFNMYGMLDGIYNFKHYVYTCYKGLKGVYQTKAKLERYPKIMGVAISEAYLNNVYVKTLKSLGLEVWVYTVNTREVAVRAMKKGATHLISDGLQPMFCD